MRNENVKTRRRSSKREIEKEVEEETSILRPEYPPP
jgi:hypothetical protein